MTGAELRTYPIGKHDNVGGIDVIEALELPRLLA
jgi:hypothetical protein